MLENYDDDTTEQEETTVKEFFDDILEKLRTSKDAFDEIYRKQKDDIKFSLLGDQWESTQIASRKVEKRTTRVFNKLSKNVRYVVNSALKNAPTIKIHPITTDKDVAEYMTGIVSQIEDQSNSKSIRSCAFQDCVAGSIGVWRVVTKEVDGVVELFEERVVDASSVYPDPEAIDPTMADINYLFHLKQITKKDYEKIYPDSDLAFLESSGKTDWYDKDTVTIAEYWCKNSDGTVSWHIINGVEIIDSSDWKDTKYPGKNIPYIFVIGEDIIVDGQREIKSIVRDCRDYQMTLNYMQSEAIDYIQKHAKSPYLASDASIEPYKQLWDNVNTLNAPYLPYVDGKAVPQRVEPPAPPVGFLDSATRLDDDIRQTIGIRDPFQDIPANVSQKTMRLQMSQDNLGTYVWIDHLNRAIKRSGQIIIDLIPHFYNYPHTQMIIGADGVVKTISIMTPFVDKDGKQKMIDLSGRFRVDISTGASYEDQKQENFENLLELFKINPQASQLGTDMLVRNMPFPESEALADRFEKLLPPQVRDNSKIDPQALKNQLDKAMQTIDQMTQVLQLKTQEVDQISKKSQEDMQKEQLKSQTTLQKAEMDNSSDYAREQMRLEYEEKFKMMEMEMQKMKMFFDQSMQPIQTTHIML